MASQANMGKHYECVSRTFDLIFTVGFLFIFKFKGEVKVKVKVPSGVEPKTPLNFFE
jgi:hypothetical protein